MLFLKKFLSSKPSDEKDIVKETRKASKGHETQESGGSISNSVTVHAANHDSTIESSNEGSSKERKASLTSDYLSKVQNPHYKLQKSALELHEKLRKQREKKSTKTYLTTMGDDLHPLDAEANGDRVDVAEEYSIQSDISGLTRTSEFSGAKENESTGQSDNRKTEKKAKLSQRKESTVDQESFMTRESMSSYVLPNNLKPSSKQKLRVGRSIQRTHRRQRSNSLDSKNLSSIAAVSQDVHSWDKRGRSRTLRRKSEAQSDRHLLGKDVGGKKRSPPQPDPEEFSHRDRRTQREPSPQRGHVTATTKERDDRLVAGSPEPVGTRLDGLCQTVESSRSSMKERSHMVSPAEPYGMRLDVGTCESPTSIGVYSWSPEVLRLSMNSKHQGRTRDGSNVPIPRSSVVEEIYKAIEEEDPKLAFDSRASCQSQGRDGSGKGPAENENCSFRRAVSLEMFDGPHHKLDSSCYRKSQPSHSIKRNHEKPDSNAEGISAFSNNERVRTTSNVLTTRRQPYNTLHDFTSDNIHSLTQDENGSTSDCANRSARRCSLGNVLRTAYPLERSVTTCNTNQTQGISFRSQLLDGAQKYNRPKERSILEDSGKNGMKDIHAFPLSAPDKYDTGFLSPPQRESLFRSKEVLEFSPRKSGGFLQATCFHKKNDLNYLARGNEAREDSGGIQCKGHVLTDDHLTNHSDFHGTGAEIKKSTEEKTPENGSGKLPKTSKSQIHTITREASMKSLLVPDDVENEDSSLFDEDDVDGLSPFKVDSAEPCLDKALCFSNKGGKFLHPGLNISSRGESSELSQFFGNLMVTEPAPMECQVAFPVTPSPPKEATVQIRTRNASSLEGHSPPAQMTPADRKRIISTYLSRRDGKVAARIPVMGSRDPPATVLSSSSGTDIRRKPLLEMRTKEDEFSDEVKSSEERSSLSSSSSSRSLSTIRIRGSQMLALPSSKSLGSISSTSLEQSAKKNILNEVRLHGDKTAHMHGAVLHSSVASIPTLRGKANETLSCNWTTNHKEMAANACIPDRRDDEQAISISCLPICNRESVTWYQNSRKKTRGYRYLSSDEGHSWSPLSAGRGKGRLVTPRTEVSRSSEVDGPMGSHFISADGDQLEI